MTDHVNKKYRSSNSVSQKKKKKKKKKYTSIILLLPDHVPVPAEFDPGISRVTSHKTTLNVTRTGIGG